MFRSITTRPEIENSKKIAKKFKKLKNIIIYSFQDKTSREKPRKNEKKKIIIPISSYPTRNRELKKNSKKIQKIKKHHYDFISSQTESGEAKKEREKKLSF